MPSRVDFISTFCSVDGSCSPTLHSSLHLQHKQRVHMSSALLAHAGLAVPPPPQPSSPELEQWLTALDDLSRADMRREVQTVVSTLLLARQLPPPPSNTGINGGHQEGPGVDAKKKKRKQKKKKKKSSAPGGDEEEEDISRERIASVCGRRRPDLGRRAIEGHPRVDTEGVERRCTELHDCLKRFRKVTGPFEPAHLPPRGSSGRVLQFCGAS